MGPGSHDKALETQGEPQRGREGAAILNESIAQDFIDALEQFSAYRISIYDERGRLVFSTRPEGMGAASSRAARVAATGTTDERLTDGGTTSVALPIVDDATPLGCIELMGRGSDIHAVAAALKMSFEIRLKFDALDREQRKAIDENERLIRRLLVPSPSAETRGPSPDEALERAGFSPDLPRLTLILESASSGFLEHFSSVNIAYDSSEDIAATVDGHVIVLKDASRTEGRPRVYLEGYIAHLREDTPFVGRVFANSLRMANAHMPQAYGMLSWLKSNASWLAPDSDTLFFPDYMSSYFMSMVPDDAFADAFSDLVAASHIDTEEFVDLTEALFENNFNLVKASARLFMHKNTLVYKLNKYKRLFAIDPMNSRTDRDLMRYLSFYLRKTSKRGGLDERD